MDKANNKSIFLTSKDTVYCCRNALITTHNCMAIICSGCRKEKCDDEVTISRRKGTSASNYKEQGIYDDTACYTGSDHGHDYKKFLPANDTSWWGKLHRGKHAGIPMKCIQCKKAIYYGKKCSWVTQL